jgi:polysaccharide export outer membrane protein
MLSKVFTFFNNNWRFLVVILLAAGCFTSCKVTQLPNSSYFKNLKKDTVFRSSVNKYTESKIRKNDQLAITIASSSMEEDRIFNAPSGSGASANSGSVSLSGGYVVDAGGFIQLHKLGSIKAEGMTRRELKEKVQRELLPFLKDPVVTVKYLNHKVTLLGEVARPTIVSMPEEQLSILEVLASGGDVSELAGRDNILIIRETENGKETKHINLEDQSIFTSPWYYLQPDDVVYISPNDYKLTEAKRLRKQQNISLALTATSLAVIIVNSILRK